MSRESPTERNISVKSEMTILKQMQHASSMAAYQPPRSKFMINDILGGNGKTNDESNERTPSIQTRDLSVFLTSIPDHDDDSDCDSSEFLPSVNFGNSKIHATKSFSNLTINIALEVIYIKKRKKCEKKRTSLNLCIIIKI